MDNRHSPTHRQLYMNNKITIPIIEHFFVRFLFFIDFQDSVSYQREMLHGRHRSLFLVDVKLMCQKLQKISSENFVDSKWPS